MEPSQDKSNLTETTELEGALPRPVPFHNCELEKLLGQNLTAKEVELLRRFNDLTSSEILNEVRLPENGAPSYRELAELLGVSNQSIMRVTDGTQEPKEKLTLTVRRKLLDNWAKKNKGKDADPSQDEVKAERLDTETEIDDKIASPIKGDLQLFEEPLTKRELSLLGALNKLDSAEIIRQLKEDGVFHSQIGKVLGHTSPSEMSRLANRQRTPGEDIRAKILSIALELIDKKSQEN